jgi:tetratricopeptide (TPR) repeat protein
MIKRLLTLIAVASLAACATRQGPPAPVVTSGQPQPAPVEPAPAPAPPKKAGPRAVQVYAYQPPSEAAKIPEEVEMAAAQAQAEAEGVDAAAEPQPPAMSEPSRLPEAAPPRSAVAAQPPEPKPPAAVQGPPAAPPAPEVASTAAADQGSQSSPADALRAQAERQRQAGDYAGAAATLERALRIQPQDARLWNRLARVRMEQGLHSQAANLAARSNALAGEQPDLKRDNWSIIATARRQAGDTAGAAEAERKARGA